MFEHLREDIASVRQRDPAARSTLEVLTCYPGLHALLFHRAGHWAWQHRLFWAGRFISYLGRCLTGIEIHPAAIIGRRVFIDHGTGVVVGETAEIGDDCTIYQGVTLGGTSLYRGTKRHPTLGKGVIVGAGAKILGGFTVDDGARIGSNAVVLKPVPANATAVGNPARIIMPEDKQTIQRNKDREKKAEEIGFCAYGVTSDHNDPLAQAILALLDHAVEADKKMDILLRKLSEKGIAVEPMLKEEASSDFDPDKISHMVDCDSGLQKQESQQ